MTVAKRFTKEILFKLTPLVKISSHQAKKYHSTKKDSNKRHSSFYYFALILVKIFIKRYQLFR